MFRSLFKGPLKREKRSSKNSSLNSVDSTFTNLNIELEKLSCDDDVQDSYDSLSPTLRIKTNLHKGPHAKRAASSPSRRSLSPGQRPRSRAHSPRGSARLPSTNPASANQQGGLKRSRFSVENLQKLAAAAEEAGACGPPSLPGQPASEAMVTDEVLAALPMTFTPFDFSVQATIGAGSFGRVHLAKFLPTGAPVALKQIRKQDVLRSQSLTHLLAEMQAMISTLSASPYLVKFLGSYQDDAFVYLVMEYLAGGEFFSLLVSNGRINEDCARFYTAEVILALEALHERDYVYRDLKPENILLDSQGHLRLCDLGFVKTVKPGDKTYTLCGTPEYSAPEVVLDAGHGKEVDWWAVGVLIYEMVAGRSPFATANHDPSPQGTAAIFQNIVTGHYARPRDVSPECLDLLDRLLAFDPATRLGRNGAAEIKAHPWFRGLDWEACAQAKIPPPFSPMLRHGAFDVSFFDVRDDACFSPGFPLTTAEQLLFSDF